MTETSTVSTIPDSARQQKSFPPPNSQMSFPGLAFRSVKASIPDTITTSGWSSDRNVLDTTIVFMPGIEVRPAAAIGSNVPRPARIVSNCLNSAEIEIWIRLDPVEFSLWPSDVTVQTHCNRIPYAPHEILFESLTVASPAFTNDPSRIN